MPRPKKPGAPEPKRRSRNGCWPCKARKVKCGEEHPSCMNCHRTGEACDYSIRLNWEGRRTKRSDRPGNENNDSPKSPSRPQRHFTLINHTFAIAGLSIPPAEQQLETFTPSVFSTPTAQSEAGKGKEEGFSCLEEGSHFMNSHQDGSFSTSPVGVIPSMASPTILGHISHLEASPASASPYHDSPNQGTESFRRPHKRAKSLAEFSDAEPFRTQSYLSSPSSLNGASPPLSRFHSRAVSISLGSPLTPAASSTYGEDDPRAPARFSLPAAASPETRRLSVHSLLSGPPGPICQLETCSFYGYDLGVRDEDIERNDDLNAISRVSPISPEATDVPFDGRLRDSFPLEFGFGLQSHPSSRGSGGYYDKPVPIRIPRDLEPLPAKLQENPMNLVYFHHFLNHTARVLVPYDDQQSNPFRTILPQMAVKNDNLLSLLLAYSASHRARILQQKEPEMRIALWVEDIFPALRQALNDSEQIICNANLATAIMLASLEIISPTAFGYDIPWQKHLSLARDLMKKRLTDLRGAHHGSKEDRVCSFLWSWFAYLDVLGSLSGGFSGGDSSSTWLLDYGIENGAEDQDEIDCIMGFTTRCVQLLAQTAELARRCDAERIGPDHRVRPEWAPSHDTIDCARLLEQDLRDSMAHQSRPCKHIHAGSVDDLDRREMAQTNEAFHWAGLVHLHRRVLGKPSSHPDVQGPVQSIIKCMNLIRRGGTAETGFLFPMFTAGCDTADEDQRTQILDRFRSVESNGMTQVHRARRLMERVWVTGQPWETLLSTEFIG